MRPGCQVMPGVPGAAGIFAFGSCHGIYRPAGARWRCFAGLARVKLVWDESAWADYVWWQAQDRKILKRVSTLITDIQRNGNEGIGKPEPLKHGFQGYWSRRITDEHRLVYKLAEDEIRIAACRYHYEH
jgi:toxin YoeB